MGKLLGPGGVRLERSIRLLCTQVWPVLYQVLTLQDQDSNPICLWCLSKEEAISRLPHNTPLHDAIQAFHRAVWAYYPDEDSLENALSVFQTGVAFLQAAADWWQVTSLPQAGRLLSPHELPHQGPQHVAPGTVPGP